MGAVATLHDAAPRWVSEPEEDMDATARRAKDRLSYGTRSHPIWGRAPRQESPGGREIVAPPNT